MQNKIQTEKKIDYNQNSQPQSQKEQDNITIKNRMPSLPQPESMLENPYIVYNIQGTRQYVTSDMARSLVLQGKEVRAVNQLPKTGKAAVGGYEATTDARLDTLVTKQEIAAAFAQYKNLNNLVEVTHDKYLELIQFDSDLRKQHLTQLVQVLNAKEFWNIAIDDVTYQGVTFKKIKFGQPSEKVRAPKYNTKNQVIPANVVRLSRLIRGYDNITIPPVVDRFIRDANTITKEYVCGTKTVTSQLDRINKLAKAQTSVQMAATFFKDNFRKNKELSSYLEQVLPGFKEKGYKVIQNSKYKDVFYDGLDQTQVNLNKFLKMQFPDDTPDETNVIQILSTLGYYSAFVALSSTEAKSDTYQDLSAMSFLPENMKGDQRIPGLNLTSSAGPIVHDQVSKKQQQNLEIIFHIAETIFSLFKGGSYGREGLVKLIQEQKVELPAEIQQAVLENKVIADGTITALLSFCHFVNLIRKAEVLERLIKSVRNVCGTSTPAIMPQGAFINQYYITRARRFPGNFSMYGLPLLKGGTDALLDDIRLTFEANPDLKAIPLYYSDNTYLAVKDPNDSKGGYYFISLDASGAESSITTREIQNILHDIYMIYTSKESMPSLRQVIKKDAQHPNSFVDSLPKVAPDPMYRYLQLSSNWCCDALALIGDQIVAYKGLNSGIFATAFFNTFQSARSFFILQNITDPIQIGYKDSEGKLHINEQFKNLVAAATGTLLTLERISYIRHDFLQTAHPEAVEHEQIQHLHTYTVSADLLGGDITQVSFPNITQNLPPIAVYTLERDRSMKSFLYDKFEKTVTSTAAKIRQLLKQQYIKVTGNDGQGQANRDIVVNAQEFLQKIRSEQDIVTQVVRALIVHPKMTQLFIMGGWLTDYTVYEKIIYTEALLINGSKPLVEFIRISDDILEAIRNAQDDAELNQDRSQVQLGLQRYYSPFPPSLYQILTIVYNEESPIWQDLLKVLQVAAIKVKQNNYTLQDYENDVYDVEEHFDQANPEQKYKMLRIIGGYESVNTNSWTQQGEMQNYMQNLLDPQPVEPTFIGDQKHIRQQQARTSNLRQSVVENVVYQDPTISQAPLTLETYGTMNDLKNYIEKCTIRKIPKAPLTIFVKQAIKELKIWTSLAYQYCVKSKTQMESKTCLWFFEQLLISVNKRIPGTVTQPKASITVSQIVKKLIQYERLLTQNYTITENTLDKFNENCILLRNYKTQHYQKKLANARKFQAENQQNSSVVDQDMEKNRTFLQKHAHNTITLKVFQKYVNVIFHELLDEDAKYVGVVTTRDVEEFLDKRMSQIMNQTFPIVVFTSSYSSTPTYPIVNNISGMMIPKGYPLWFYPIIRSHMFRVSRINVLISKTSQNQEPASQQDWQIMSASLLYNKDMTYKMEIKLPFEKKMTTRRFNPQRAYYLIMQSLRYNNNMKSVYPKIRPGDSMQALKILKDYDLNKLDLSSITHTQSTRIEDIRALHNSIYDALHTLENFSEKAKHITDSYGMDEPTTEDIANIGVIIGSITTNNNDLVNQTNTIEGLWTTLIRWRQYPDVIRQLVVRLGIQQMQLINSIEQVLKTDNMSQKLRTYGNREMLCQQYITGVMLTPKIWKQDSNIRWILDAMTGIYQVKDIIDVMNSGALLQQQQAIQEYEKFVRMIKAKHGS